MDATAEGSLFDVNNHTSDDQEPPAKKPKIQAGSRCRRRKVSRFLYLHFVHH